MSKKIGFIGTGNMAYAIISGMLKNGTDPKSLFAYDTDSEKLAQISEKGILACGSAAELLENCEIIVLAVKPQVYPVLLESLKSNATEDKVFVSIAAGISTDYIKKSLSCNCPCVRVMPNTPLLLGKGATALSRSEDVSDTDFELVYSMFASSGVCEVLPESKMNAVIALNGSSPAYFYLFAKAMADYAQSQGIDSKAAMNLICATMQGSAQMLMDSGDTPQELIKKVSSPGGTTLASLADFEENHFEDIVKSAMDKCTKRADELSK